MQPRPDRSAVPEAHPGIELELTVTDRYVDAVDEGYDAVLRLGPIGDSGLAARELVRHALIACASPAYLAAHGTPGTPEELGSHARLEFVNWSGRPYEEWRFTRDERFDVVRIRSRFQVNDSRVLLAAALRGHGVVLQPEALLRGALDAGPLVPILTNYAPPSRPMYLMFVARRPQPPKLRAFKNLGIGAFGRDSSEHAR